MNTPTRAPDGEGYFLYHSISMYPDKALRTAEALSPGNLTTMDGVERCMRTLHKLLRASAC